MGVTGLWQLLEPVGRRISIEALQNKRLAVDASMWLFQFVRAMRDDRGEMVRNAHVIGFFRRICKLLFHRIRPVFVFDGSTPALKQQTVAARRRRREQQSARVNRLAEKLLLNQLKQSVLGKVTEAQLRKAAGGQGRGRGSGGRGRGRAARAAAGQDRQEQQEQEFEAGNGSGGGTAAAAASAGSAQMPGSAAIPTSGAATCGARQPMHGQRQASAPAPLAVQAAAAAAAAGTWHNQEGPDSSAVAAAAAAAAADSTAADELLAAQLAAEQWDEEEASVALAAAAAGGASGQALQLPSVFSTLSEQRHQERARRRAGQAGGDGGGEGESSGDDDELEIVLPEGGQLDPAVMSTLPPSVALDLMMKMRERKQAESRREFEARRAAPAAFSSFQMQTYLAGTRFRQQVSDVKDAMNASAAGGSAARRIAGEAGREYVLHKEPQTGAAPATAATAAAAATQQDAATDADGVGSRQAGPAAAPKAPAAAPAAAAAASAALPAAPLPGLRGNALDICFDVELEDGKSDEDMGWEDVEQASPGHAPQQGQQQQAVPQHWRQRAAQRQKYWSVSHGFQMGRKLAAWGEDEPGEGAGLQAGGQAGAAADDEGGTTPGVRKGLIGRSPPSRSPIKPAPEDEDGQLQEAIRRSLEDVTPGKGSGAAVGASRRLSLGSSEDGSPGAAPTLAAAAARMLEQKQRLLQRAHPHQQQQGQQPSRAEVVDLTGAHEAAAEGSGSEAEVLLEDAAAASGPDGAAASQQAQLLATINQQSARRLEEWLGGGDTGNGAATAAASLVQNEAQPDHGFSAARAGATAAAATASWKDDEHDMLWEDAQPALPAGSAPAAPAGQNQALSPHSQGAATPAAAALAPPAAVEGLGAAAAGDAVEEVMDWEDADAVVQAAAKPEQSQLPLQAEHDQQQQPERRAAAATGTMSERAGGQRVPQPALAPAQALGAPAEQQRGQQRGPPQVQAVQPAARAPGAAVALRAAAAASAPEPARAAQGALAAPFSGLAGAVEDDSVVDVAQRSPGHASALPALEAGAPLGGFAAAELEELALLEEEDAWEAPSSQPGQQQAPQQAEQQQQQQALQPPPQQVLQPPPQLVRQQQEEALQQQQQAPQQQGAGPGGEGHALLDVEAQLEALQAEERAMKAAQRKGQGQSDQPTQDMYQDCMELLQMFGLPYIIAPQEAEAQCAWLDYNDLVDGVVTDDNDVFLFGARRVYRHIFESKKYVEEYRAEDVQSELGVGRAELARLAQLLGGDYCEGVAGVGIVNAMEVVHAFPGPDGLRRFREWLDAPDEELVELARGKSGVASAGKPPRAPKGRQARGDAGGGGEAGEGEAPAEDGGRGRQAGTAGASEAHLPGPLCGPGEGELQGGDPEEASAAARLAVFKRTHRGVRRSWDPPASFPSAAVDQAYAEPKVDSSREKFTFGRPDVELLRQFCQSRLGWTRQQADDLLLPVAAAYDQRQSQLTLDSFLTKRERFAKIRSKRLQQAVMGVAGGEREELMLKLGDDAPPAGAGATGDKKRKASGAAAAAAGAEGDGQRGAGQGAAQQQQEQQRRQERRNGSVHVGPAKRQRRQAADGGPGRGRGGRGGGGGRGRGTARGRGSGTGAAGDASAGHLASSSDSPTAAHGRPGEPRAEPQGQQQELVEPAAAAVQPDGSGGRSQQARRQPSRGRRAVVVLPLPDDA